METDDILVREPDVRKSFGGVSSMWIYRRLADDPTFPKPLYISKRRFWKRSELVAWERGVVARQAVAS
jgi:predicted DNA-binding transcriptional regulator AlpA